MGEAEVWAAGWQRLASDAFGQVMAWRRQHPQATLREIELAMDERLARVRAQMLQDTVLASPLADLRAVASDERPACPRGGGQLRPRGQRHRHLTTMHEQPVVLSRGFVDPGSSIAAEADQG